MDQFLEDMSFRLQVIEDQIMRLVARLGPDLPSNVLCGGKMIRQIIFLWKKKLACPKN